MVSLTEELVATSIVSILLKFWVIRVRPFRLPDVLLRRGTRCSVENSCGSEITSERDMFNKKA
jgi:hypothetical protein